MDKLYKKDYVLWSKQQANLLKEKRFDEVDWESLLTEFVGLRREDEEELKTRITILIQKLLEWQYKPDFRCDFWRCMIGLQRMHLEHFLEDNPGLNVVVDRILPQAYERAIYEASLITGEWFDQFWAHLWPFETIMDEGFWPERWADETVRIVRGGQ